MNIFIHNMYIFNHIISPDKTSSLTKVLLISAIVIPFIMYVIGSNPFRLELVQPFAVVSSFFLLGIVLLIATRYNANTVCYYGVVYCAGFKLFNSPIMFGFDGLTLAFVLLTTILTPYCVMSCWDLEDSNRCTFYIFLVELFLILSFTSIDLFWFYFYFEATILPIIILINYWGVNKRRKKALLYYFIYSIVGSFIMIIGIIAFYVEFGTTCSVYLYILPIRSKESTTQELIKQAFIWVPLMCGFATKIPLLPFTLWLPEAHVEAPTCGSILLAGLLLKVGGYGIVKFLSLAILAQSFFQPFMVILCTIGILYGAAAAAAQVDIKRIIAYSSIVHINIATIGVFTLTKTGGVGGLLIIFSHGIVSVGLFYLIGILYVRHGTRLVSYYCNLSTVMPLFSVFFVFFILSNISFPLSISFLGELIVIIALVKKQIWFTLFFLSIALIINIYYSLLVIQKLLYGSYDNLALSNHSDLTETEYIVLLQLTIYNVGLFIFPRFLINLFGPFFAFRYLAI